MSDLPRSWDGRESTLAKILRDPERYRRMSEDMGDMEFQMAIAPYMNYKGDIDPAKSRTHMLHPSVGRFGPGQSWTTRGMYSYPQNKEFTKEFPIPNPVSETDKTILFNIEPDTVNTFGAPAAKPTVQAHEYLHENLKKDADESDVRLIGAWNAQNEDDWDDSVRGWASHLLEEEVVKTTTLQKAEAHLLRSLQAMKNRRRFEDNAFDKYLRENPNWERKE